jgi:hypothetical protein
MKKGLLSLAALSFVCVGFASDDAKVDVSKPLVLDAKKDTDQTNHGWISGFLQEQYFSSDKGGANSGFFRNRRTRLNYNYIGDEKTMGRFSIEFASGTNNSSSQVRDAFIQYKPGGFKASSGPTFTVGAQSIPIGYENGYSTPNIMWSERSVYQGTFFNSEASKGLLFQNGDAKSYWYVGLFDSLTIGDPEQSDVTTKGEVLPVAGIHHKFGAFEGGISGLYGKSRENRPKLHLF